VATGGETARAVLGTLGATRLDVLGELEPGVVRCAVPGRGLGLTLKAGAFGDPDTLLRCLAWPSDPVTPASETVRHPSGSRGEQSQ
jgi:4-hydroxythreonine-4-phosphate dehydrogenase